MHWQHVPPADPVPHAMREVRGAAELAEVTVQAEVADGLPNLQVDRDRILHVLTNLLTNAIKYSPSGGEIRVCVRSEGDRRVYFGIIDQGPGIPPEYHQRIFQKFYRRPDEKKTGVGLGLAIAQEFVKAHDGEIGVKSEPPNGSEFYMVLPVNPE
jgi:signal transduction histidine kinase